MTGTFEATASQLDVLLRHIKGEAGIGLHIAGEAQMGLFGAGGEPTLKEWWTQLSLMQEKRSESVPLPTAG